MVTVNHRHHSLTHFGDCHLSVMRHRRAASTEVSLQVHVYYDDVMFNIMYAIARTGFKQWSLAISQTVSLSRVHAKYLSTIFVTTKCMVYRTGSLGELRELGSSTICYSAVLLLGRTNTD